MKLPAAKGTSQRAHNTRERGSVSPAMRNVTLCALFALFFVLPPLAAYVALERWARRELSFAAPAAEVFSDAIDLRGSRGVVRVLAADDLNPLADKDFLIGLWIKPRNLPASPQVVTVFSRTSARDETKWGYALALSRDGDSLRATVLWRAASGAGRTFVFSDIPHVPQGWMLLALSHHDRRYLGLHTVTRLLNQAPLVRLAGGYDLGGPVVPDSSADLLLGTHRAGGYRGFIGGVVLIQSKDLTKDLARTLKKLGNAPREFPNTVSERSIRLWSDDLRTDRSRFGHSIVRELSAPGRAKSRLRGAMVDDESQ